MTSLRCALIQTRTPARQEQAFDHIAPLIEDAVQAGAKFIATPEGSNLLQRDRDLFAASVSDVAHDPFVRGVTGLAQQYGVHILLGSVLVRREDGHYANRSLLISAAGDVTAAYDKIHMFDVDLPTGEHHRESSLYTPGERAVVAATPWGELGLSICYDLRFPKLYRELALAGAKVIAVPAAFTRPTGKAHWHVLLRARAIETGAFILAPAQGGVHEDGRATFGHSLVVSPWGELIGELAHDNPGVLVCDLDVASVDATRAAIPSLINERAYAAP